MPAGRRCPGCRFQLNQQWTKLRGDLTLAFIMRLVLQSDSSGKPVGGAIMTERILQLMFLGFKHLLHLCLLAKFS